MAQNVERESKKKTLQNIIKQRHHSLTLGCGAKRCKNPDCVSSGKRSPIDPDSAFKEAIEFAKKNQDFCPKELTSHIVFSLLEHPMGPMLDLLLPVLDSVLSDPQKLSMSFLNSNITNNLAGIVTVDKDEIEEAYRCLFKSDNTEIEDAVNSGLSKLVESLAVRLKANPKESRLYLNALIIFLLNPKLQDPDYAGYCFKDLCGVLATLRIKYKVNLIHYISTLPSDTITTMIYNFQQVIAIGIAMKAEEELLYRTRPVCDGVLCLQLLYGAVVYRAQHTIHHVLGDLSLSKQTSRDLPTPVTPYTSSNPLAATLDPETVEPPSSEPINIRNPTAVSNHDSDNATEENTDSLPSASDILLPLLAMEGSLGLSLDEEDEGEDEDGEEDGEDGIGGEEDGEEERRIAIGLDDGEDGEEAGGAESPADDSAVRFLQLLADDSPDGEEGEEEDDENARISDFIRMQVSSLLRGHRPNSGSSGKPPASKLFTELGINPLWDSHTNIDLSLFYNDDISQLLKVDEDYLNYKTGRGFSFMHYPFVLRPHVKSVGLQYDNRISMTRSVNPLLMFISGGYPHLKLTVKRENIIEDALTHLEMVAEEDPGQLQRQLYVEFEGEEGVDEGGVSKEFFQLIIAELFNPVYGMFVDIEDTRMVWFNPQSFEVDHNYKLIGMLLGLAVYNTVILDIRFPTALYQKLMGEKPDIRDLIQSHPQIGSSLQQLLDYPGEDVEEVFMLDFMVSTTGLFGETITHHLIEGGDEVPVTSENKHQFVEKYVDYIFNTSVSKQFDQFKKGFDMIAQHSPLQTWFRPEELEKLIVGSPKLDFVALQGVTRYDNGYTEDTPAVKWFWEVTHAMSDDDKSKLLAFVTGCGRAPVGGMGEMNFHIVKNGGDSERLPSAHTCFNVLLLPEYATVEKLKEKLYKAIQHFEGFGMI